MQTGCARNCLRGARRSEVDIGDVSGLASEMGGAGARFGTVQRLQLWSLDPVRMKLPEADIPQALMRPFGSRRLPIKFPSLGQILTLSEDTVTAHRLCVKIPQEMIELLCLSTWSDAPV